jgi:uncharacterized protein (TIGR02147 family)
MSKSPFIGFLDYRKWLREWSTEQCQKLNLSLNEFCQTFSVQLGLTTPNYLKLVLEGKRNISEKLARKISRHLGLSYLETKEFIQLVAFTQASKLGDRQKFLADLVETRAVDALNAEQKRKPEGSPQPTPLPNWISWMIYAAMDLEDSHFEADYFYKLLQGKASIKDIASAMKDLIEIGSIVEPQPGEFRKNPLAFTSQKLAPEFVQGLQASLTQISIEKLFELPPEEREINNLTLALTQKEFEDLKLLLRKTRKQILLNHQIQRAQTKADTLYQVSFHLFPIAKSADIYKSAQVVRSPDDSLESPKSSVDNSVEEVDNL